MDDRLLRAMSETASSSAERFLKEHDVNIWLKVKVVSFDGDKVVLSNGRDIPTKNVIWAAGVAGALIPGLPAEACSGSGRIKTDEFNRVAGCQNVYAIGDVACVSTEKTPKGYPMLAPVAVQQAKNLAGNLKIVLSGEKELKPFIYNDLGVMATVGRHHAVADVFFGKFQGLLAWVMWAGLHLLTLVGFRNKLVAVVNWTWSYFRYDRGLRLIIRGVRRSCNL
jgi:NADH dehydrogenase